jgi:hypothetical protein
LGRTLAMAFRFSRTLFDNVDRHAEELPPHVATTSRRVTDL